MRFLAGLIDLVFPPRRVCPFCGAREEQNSICDRCLQVLDGFRQEPVCCRCGRYFRQFPRPEPTLTGFEEVYCRDCLEVPRSFIMARAAGPYQDDLKRVIQRLKYSGRKGLARHLAGIMLQSVAGQPQYLNVQVVVPVPLSPGRLRQRGFNQAELIAFELAGQMAVSVLPAVRKSKETSPQTGLDRAGREHNLLGAFSLTNPAAVRGKTILLVDDVITTGTTLDSVAQVLVKGGAAAVLGLVSAAGRTQLAYTEELYCQKPEARSQEPEW